MAELFGRDDRRQRRPRRLDAPLRRIEALHGRLRHRRRAHAAGLRAGAGEQAPEATAASSLCIFGDGAVNEGEFHEALNLAAVWKLPVIFLCENNLYGMGTDMRRVSAETEVYKRAEAYDIPRRAGRRHGRAGRARSGRKRLAAPVRAGKGPSSSRRSDLPLPRPLDGRPGVLPDEGRGRSAGASSIPDQRKFRDEAARSTTTIIEREARERCRRRRTSMDDAARFAEESPDAGARAAVRARLQGGAADA